KPAENDLSISSVVRALFHWLGGSRMKVKSRSPASSRPSATALHLSRHLRRKARRRVSISAAEAAYIIYDWREYAASGGLISYGMSFTATYRLAGIYVGKILKGATPADLQVQQPT